MFTGALPYNAYCKGFEMKLGSCENLAQALGRPRGVEWGGRRDKGSGWGTHVYLWRIHFDIWQN